MKKRLFVYVVLCAVTIVAGLSIRRHAASLSIVGQYAPDALWAMLIYWLFAIVLFERPLPVIAVTSILFCYLDEISQLYHAPWIDSIRATRLGGLVLGFGFLWSDLVCYTVGVACAVSIDFALRKRSIRRPR